MPSPIAHSAVAFLLWPSLRKTGGLSDENAQANDSAQPLTPPQGEKEVGLRTWSLIGGLLIMLNAPDLDMVPHLLLGPDTWISHGGATHSLFVGAVAACVFASIFHWMFGIDWKRLWIIGALAWWSHTLLDYFTYGGGVAALWPLTAERFSSPVPLFFGVRHSQPWAWHLHLITIATELVFLAVVWFMARRWNANGRPSAAVQGSTHVGKSTAGHEHDKRDATSVNHAQPVALMGDQR